MLKGIKNIIFDLGGVIINIDPALTINAFKQHGASDFDTLYKENSEKGLFIDYEKGLVSSDDFIKGINRFFPFLSPRQIADYWNALLLDIPPNRLKLLKTLKDKYQLYLLSNTNELHINAANNYLRKAHGENDLKQFFIKAYYSHELKRRKPEPEIFEHVLQDAKIKPEETLFIDDTMEHIISAKSIGINAYHHHPKDSVADLF